MTVLEEEKKIESRARIPLNLKSSRANPEKLNFHSRWTPFLCGLVLFWMSLSLGGMMAVQKNIESSVHSKVNNFRWLVLVEGGQLQFDEVGRYIKQIEGVEDVTFTSPQQAIQILQKDPLVAENTSELSPEEFPGSWEVQWSRDSFGKRDFQDIRDDLLRFPSVLDVAFDPQQIKDISRFQWHSSQLKMILSMLLLVGTIGFLWLLGIAVFKIKKKALSWKKCLTTVSLDTVFWVLGYLLIWQLFGPPFLGFIGLGVAVGFLHFIWNAYQSSEGNE